MLNRKGYSMVEMIVCLAILAIVAIGAFGISSHIRLSNVNKCAKELNSYMEKARLTTMSKSGSPSVCIYKTKDGIYYKLSTEKTITKTDGIKIGASGIKVFFTEKGSGSEMELTETNNIKFKFTKDTGAFISDSNAKLYDTIRVASSGGTSYTIHMVEKTGWHYVK